MRWNGRRSSPEERFESWIGQEHQKRVLRGEVTATGPCPDEAFLRDLARKSKRILLSDPRINHAASCSACMNRLLAFRAQAHAHHRRMVLATAAAACLVIIVVALVLTRLGAHNQPQASNLAVVPETVNLWNTNTVRGAQPSPLESVSLPAARVRVTVILPRFSEPGRYVVAVTRDPAGGEVVAEGAAASSKNGERQEVSVELDLRHAATGKYFLATTHERDQASYYYPLRIQ